MKSKGIRIVRYADDILIFAKDKQTAGNYRAVATKILEKELLLKVNEVKTKMTSVYEGVEFLGFVIYEKWVVVQDKRFKRFKDKIREITRRNAGRSLETVIKDFFSTSPNLSNISTFNKLIPLKAYLLDLSLSQAHVIISPVFSFFQPVILSSLSNKRYLEVSRFRMAKVISEFVFK